ncbi:MAG: hypothetical protein ACYC6L_15870 [Anaerolineae bacterium]
MLPSVDFCGLQVTRLVIGGNPFAGYSHQDEGRDQAMRAYYTVARIKETWARAEAAGINTMVTNNTHPGVVQAVREYLREGGALQWIAQVNLKTVMEDDIRAAVEIGCKAVFFHGALGDTAYQRRDSETLKRWCGCVRSYGIPAGVAGHAPEVHAWLDQNAVADFNVVCFFNCGSLHAGQGTKFNLGDLAPATAVIRAIGKPCIAYKIMGAGRIDPQTAFEYAFNSIKPGDVVNVGMYRGDKDDMVEENAVLVRRILG